MTQTRTEARPPAGAGVAIGQAVGQAEAVLTRLLAGVLAETGTARETYLALQRLSAHADTIGREGYVRDLSDWLDLDLWSAGELADRLVASGLLTLTGGTIRLAAAGSELRERIRHLAGDVTAPLYAKLDPADIETTVRTLRDLTMLARAMRSDAVPSGAAAGANGGGR